MKVNVLDETKPNFKRNNWFFFVVSMISSELFDKLEAVVRGVRFYGNHPRQAPTFGGVQIVVTGDFLQLPPVTRTKTTVDRRNSARVVVSDRGFFAFQSEAWKKTIRHEIVLTKVQRQANAEFAELLNSLRIG